MNCLHKTIQTGLLFTLLLSVGSVIAVDRYVSDEFEVTMRSGTSTSNSIVQLLKSGEKVILLEEDLASQYSLVETENGKKGYVLSRFLDDIPSARQRLQELQQKSQLQAESMNQLLNEVDQLKKELENEQADNESLKSTLLASETELENVRSASENTLKILDDNQRLNSIVKALREEKKNLSEENFSLKDSSQMDWFIRGATVSLIAFLLGIIVTRIRWRKKDSWGSY